MDNNDQQQGLLSKLELLVQTQLQNTNLFTATKELQYAHALCSPNAFKALLSQIIALNNTPATSEKAYTLLNTLLSDTNTYTFETLLEKQPDNKEAKANQKLESIYHEALIQLINIRHPALQKHSSFKETPYIENTLKIADLLLAKLNQNCNIRDQAGNPPLHHAINLGHTDFMVDVKSIFVDYLISKGADINQQDNKGDTLLHKICREIYHMHDHPGYCFEEFTHADAETILYSIYTLGVAVGIKNNHEKTPLEELPHQYQAFIQSVLHQHTHTMITTLRLNQPNQTKNILSKDKQKMMADLWRQLGKHNQMILCNILELEYPHLRGSIRSYLASFKAIIAPYLFAPIINLSHTFFTTPHDEQHLSVSRPIVPRETLNLLIKTPQEIKHLVMEQLFEDRLVSQDYSFLNISIENQKQLSITPKGLLSMLIETLTQNACPHYSQHQSVRTTQNAFNLA